LPNTEKLIEKKRENDRISAPPVSVEKFLDQDAWWGNIEEDVDEEGSGRQSKPMARSRSAPIVYKEFRPVVKEKPMSATMVSGRRFLF
jgi:hypothetical protein